MPCANLREISWSFLRESSRLKIFVREVNAKKELFSWADLYVSGSTHQVEGLKNKLKGYTCNIIQTGTIKFTLDSCSPSKKTRH